jgi:hypothetical protein
MKYFRQGTLNYYDGFTYCIEEKKWWGWKTVIESDDVSEILHIREQIESKGGIFI